MNEKIDIYQDGACNNKLENAPAGVGVAVFINDEYKEEHSRAIGIKPYQLGIRNTSNVAEWQACIEAMRVLSELVETYPTAEFRIYSDSQVISQVFNDTFVTQNPAFIQYKKEAKKLMAQAGFVLKIHWIPRKLNQKADDLSKEGLQLAFEKRKS
jgi:ribonuclease HI